MNPQEDTINHTNAAGTQEQLSAHVAAIVLIAGAGVLLLRLGHFKFVVAAGANVSGG